MDVIEIVDLYLKEHGYDGLYSEGLCACEAGDLAPCGQINGSCAAGYKHARSVTGDFVISSREKLSDDEIQKILDEL